MRTVALSTSCVTEPPTPLPFASTLLFRPFLSSTYHFLGISFLSGAHALTVYHVGRDGRTGGGTNPASPVRFSRLKYF